VGIGAVYTGRCSRVSLRAPNSPLRKAERLRKLFRRYRKLTRPEVVEILGISPNTASRYLRDLRAEGCIEKIMPSGAPRTHYFQLVEQGPG